MSVSLKRRRNTISVYFNWPGHPERINQPLGLARTKDNIRIAKRDIVPQIKDEIAHLNWEALHTRFPEVEDFRARMGGRGLKMADLFTAMKDNWKNEKCRSLKDLLYKHREIQEWFQNKFVCDVDLAEINRFVAKLDARGVSAATKNRKVAQIKRAFNYAVEKKLLTPADLPAFPDHFAEPVARQTRYQEHEIELLLTKLPERLRGGVDFASMCGWRLSEVFSRKKSDIQPDGQGGFFLHLDELHSKNKEPRDFPVTPRLRALLDKQLAWVHQLELEHGMVIPYLFPNDDARHQIGDRIKRIDKAFQTACDEAGLNIDPDTQQPRVHPETGKPMNRWFHDFRRYASDYLEALGLSDEQIMQVMGHKTNAMRRRYRGQVTREKVLLVGARIAAAEAVRPASKVVAFVPHTCHTGADGVQSVDGSTEKAEQNQGVSGWAGSESNTRHKDFQSQTRG